MGSKALIDIQAGGHVRTDRCASPGEPLFGGLAVFVIAMLTVDRRYHLALVFVHLAYQAYWITQLFTIHI